MNDIEDRILQVFQEEDRVLLEKYKQPRILTQIRRSFEGEQGLIMSMLIFWGIAATVLIGFCIYYYVNSIDVQVRELCVVGFISGWIMVAFIKLFFYQQLGQLSILREIKRLELQVSLLAEKK